MNKGKVGEWVRHTSSSGKEYYFHVTKQISQWEKPKEWLEFEKRHGPVPNVPYVSSSQKNQKIQHQTHNSGNHVSANSTTKEDKEKEQRKVQQGHQQQQEKQQQHQNANAANKTNSISNFAGASTQHQNATATTASHHSHLNANNNRLEVNFLVHHQSSSALSYSSRGSNSNSNNNNNKHSSVATNATGSTSNRDTRKPSEDLQTEDMDISPLDDNNSPVSIDSKQTQINSHHFPTPITTSGPPSLFQTHFHHPHHYPSSKNLQDGTESSRDRDDNLRNSAFHQHSNNSRLTHQGSSNNGYHGRDRDREMRDSPRRPDRDARDYRDNKDFRDYRDYRDKDSRDRDRDRMRRDRDRDSRASPRRYDRDRNDRDRDHRGRNRDREYRDNKIRHRSTSKLRDERSRSPRERDNTPERPGGESVGVSGLGSLGALAALNSDTETTPLQSLAQYFREDLIAHAQDLPGDELERQANLLSDEIMTVSSIQLSKVCAELKMARSLVRLTDIQATLQDQKIMFLRQQIKHLEESNRDNSSSMLGLDTGS